MRPHPRIRKTIKWGGLAASVVLAVTWAGSIWGAFEWHEPSGYLVYAVNGTLRLGHNGISFQHAVRYSSMEWTVVRVPPSIKLWPQFDRLPARPGVCAESWRAEVPIWLLVLPVVLVTVAVWRIDVRARYRARVGCCLKCGYDRRGLGADAVCPECGEAAEGGVAAAPAGKTPA